MAGRCWELTSFLSEVLDYTPPDISSLLEDKSVTYHDSCAGLRELGIQQQPRNLLSKGGVQINELQGTEVCCGFGGTFCAKMPEISEKMVTDKLDAALATGADMLLGGDLGCLLNISGRASRLGKTLEIRHIAEVLAGDLQEPAIGEGET